MKNRITIEGNGEVLKGRFKPDGIPFGYEHFFEYGVSYTVTITNHEHLKIFGRDGAVLDYWFSEDGEADDFPIVLD